MIFLLIQIVSLFVAVFIGTSIYVFFKKYNFNIFEYSLIYSGSFLFSIALLHILPDIYKDYSLIIGISLILGFFIQFILELFSGGVEHGHISEPKNKNNLKFFIPLCLHALLDSIILYDSQDIISKKNILVLTSIILHKIPAAFALTSILFSNSKDKTKNFLYLSIFASISPLGIVLNKLLFYNLHIGYIRIIKAIAGGSFLSIATTIFFESSDSNHTIDIKKLFIIFLGLGSALLTELFHWHN